MTSDIFFDNFMITDDRNTADRWANDGWGLKKSAESAAEVSSESLFYQHQEADVQGQNPAESSEVGSDKQQGWKEMKPSSSPGTSPDQCGLLSHLQTSVVSSHLIFSPPAWSGNSDVERSRGTSLALGGLRPHRGPAADPHLCLLLHRQGETHTCTRHLSVFCANPDFTGRVFVLRGRQILPMVS